MTMMLLSSIGKMELASFANGWRIGTIRLGLIYFNCAMWVTYEPMVGRLVALVSSRAAPTPFAWSDCTAFTNLSPILITEMLLSASTACKAWMASVLVD